jgi:hypothetical protein
MTDRMYELKLYIVFLGKHTFKKTEILQQNS